ncbi:C39 family peptidase [Apilactobacillus micheneri]|uniref:C39 family peptidase n=1 Tax=Apilactobacillus micheneri TaxID=1899430 RepID=UPI001126EA74|nr:C39 family peptidase [Apilactobacillus micheneri]TPR39081.1 hypothetical protein DY119_05305 [Apilactobacillus micheneri]
MKRKLYKTIFVIPILVMFTVCAQTIGNKAYADDSNTSNNQNNSQNIVNDGNQSSTNNDNSATDSNGKTINDSKDNNQSSENNATNSNSGNNDEINNSNNNHNNNPNKNINNKNKKHKRVNKHKYFRILSTKKTNFSTIIKKNRSLYRNGAYNTNEKNIKSYKNSKYLINKLVNVTEFENTKLGKYAHIVHNGKDQGWINNSALDYATFKLNNVPLIRQRPQLPTGCEITAVTMMINYATGKHYKKTFFANKMPRSSNPNKGFVGSPYSKSGWYIYPPALMKLVHKYLNSSVNLTGKSTNYLKIYLKKYSHPIVIWIANVDGFPNHAVTVTGFNKNQLYYNDPWLGKRTNMNISSINIHRSNDNNRAISY